MKSCLDKVLVATVAIELIVMAKSAIEGDLCPCYLSLFLHQPPADAISHLALLFPHEVVVPGNQGQVIRMLNRKKTFPFFLFFLFLLNDLRIYLSDVIDNFNLNCKELRKQNVKLFFL